MSDRKLVLENIASQQLAKAELYRGEIDRRKTNPKWDGIPKREKEESIFYEKKEGAWRAIKPDDLKEVIKQAEAVRVWCLEQLSRLEEIG